MDPTLLRHRWNCPRSQSEARVCGADYPLPEPAQPTASSCTNGGFSTAFRRRRRDAAMRQFIDRSSQVQSWKPRTRSAFPPSFLPRPPPKKHFRWHTQSKILMAKEAKTNLNYQSGEQRPCSVHALISLHRSHRPVFHNVLFCFTLKQIPISACLAFANHRFFPPASTMKTRDMCSFLKITGSSVLYFLQWLYLATSFDALSSYFLWYL